MARWVGVGTQQPRVRFEPATSRSQVWPLVNTVIMKIKKVKSWTVPRLLLVPYLHQTPQSTSDDEPWTASLHPVTNHKLHRACSKESAPQEPAPQCLLHRAHSPKACSTELALQEQAPQCLIHRAHSSRACSSLCSSVLAPQSSLFKSLLLRACFTKSAPQQLAPQCLLYSACASEILLCKKWHKYCQYATDHNLTFTDLEH